MHWKCHVSLFGPCITIMPAHQRQTTQLVHPTLNRNGMYWKIHETTICSLIYRKNTRKKLIIIKCFEFQRGIESNRFPNARHQTWTRHWKWLWAWGAWIYVADIKKSRPTSVAFAVTAIATCITAQSLQSWASSPIGITTITTSS